MKNLLFTALLMCFALSVLAQYPPGNSARRERIYTVNLKHAEGYSIQRGILVGTTDSTLLVSPNTEKAIQLIRMGKPLVQAVPVGTVHKLVFRKKGKVIRSTIISAGIGVIPALIYAATTKSDPIYAIGFFFEEYRRTLIAMVAVSGAGVGAVVGAGVGLLPNAKISINGNPETYKSMRVLIEGYTLSTPSGFPTSISTPLSVN